MADQVTPSEKTPEDIEREMLQTRESITEKVAALESQVVGSVQTAADTLSDTVAAVKSFVSHAPETVSDSVKQATAAVSDAVKSTFDISAHVDRHPWAAVGASALVGCVVGWLVSRGRSDSPVFSAMRSHAAPATASARPLADEKPGLADEFMGMIGDKAKELARTALETVATAVKENIQTGLPHLVNDAASRLTDAGTDTVEQPFTHRFNARPA
ncbi:DUF883 family protein [Frigoriglobus tundricola]|uniref:DUF3618 domain-containing protein n=1 Tax=Frigoriglobus tundricola TaxID=2774151 RepID=A0A6M5Z0S2_9BACT|nr:hypothetical protein [Frigoriglobus tundricola]QJW99011.1 hypothetical protein FTUN_6607 [Frigoriglobus tundricola]